MEENRKWKRTGSGREQEVEESRKWKRTGSEREQEVEREQDVLENRKWKRTGSGREQKVSFMSHIKFILKTRMHSSRMRTAPLPIVRVVVATRC